MSAHDSSSQPSADENSDSAPCQVSQPVRRSAVVHLLTAAVSFVIVGIPSAIAGLFFLDPLLRKRGVRAAGGTATAAARKDEAGFIRLSVSGAVLPHDGTPVLVTVQDDIEDAWNYFRDVPVGSVWLRKSADGRITALHSVCPHLGCSVNYRQSAGDFYCPCHTSAFALDGQKTNQIPPRNMDSLEVSIRTDGREDPAGAEIWVKFQNFRKGVSEKTPQ